MKKIRETKLKGKNIFGKNIIGFIVAIALLIVSGFVGKYAGAFDSFFDAFKSFKKDPQVLIEVLVVICFLYALKCIVNIVFGFVKVNKARTKTLTTIIASIIKYAIFLIGFCWVLGLLGVNVSTIFASIGVLALIVGFGAESLVSDVVTGLFILIENQFNVGDIIEVDGFRGTVENISIRTVSIKDAGGNIKIINNSDISNVINRSSLMSVAITEVGVSYDEDIDKLEKKIPGILNEIKERHKDIFVGQIFYLGVENLADSSVVLKMGAEVTEENLFTGKRLLNKEIKSIFDREKIVIAYPQIDIHTK